MKTAVWYEQPLNERIRTLLRLEFLFAQIDHACAGFSEWDSRAALAGLIEVLSLLGRNELRSELIKELERHATTINRLRGAAGTDARALATTLTELGDTIAEVHALDSRAIEDVRQMDFLAALRQRSSIPGGTCRFDLPALHHWLQREPEVRQQQLALWLEPLTAVRRAVALILRLVRAAADPAPLIAQAGFYQLLLDSAAPNQLVRVALRPDAGAFPEISGGRHRFSIRFLCQPDPARRPYQTDEDVGFQLACCVL